MSLKGQTAVITGASRGIGKAIAARFAQEGANVVFNYLEDSTEANANCGRVGKDRSTSAAHERRCRLRSIGP